MSPPIQVASGLPISHPKPYTPNPETSILVPGVNWKKQLALSGSDAPWPHASSLESPQDWRDGRPSPSSLEIWLLRAFGVGCGVQGLGMFGGRGSGLHYERSSCLHRYTALRRLHTSGCQV